MMLFCEPWFASLGFFYLFFAICHWLPNGKSAGQHYDDQEPNKLCRTWLAVEARRNLGSAARRAQRCKKQRRLAVRHVPECGRPGDGLENDTLLYFAAVQDVKGAFSIIGDGPSPASGRRDLNPRPLDPQSSALPSCATSRCPTAGTAERNASPCCSAHPWPRHEDVGHHIP